MHMIERAPPATGMILLQCSGIVAMASTRRLVLLSLFLSLNWAVVPAQQEDPTNSLDLDSLRELVEATFEDNIETVYVDLPEGHREVIGTTIREIERVNVNITGTDSVIECESQSTGGELPLDNYSEFPLIFSESSLVVIRGVQFRGCLRPLRFKWVTRIELILSSFRYNNYTYSGTLRVYS